MKLMLELLEANALTPTPNGTTLLHAAALCSPGKWKESRNLSEAAISGKCDTAACAQLLGLERCYRRAALTAAVRL